jgi:glycosyltransferase involved in cell wall biosynthesis
MIFVVPEMTAEITGGNLYNLGLTRALGARARVVDRDGAEAVLREDGAPCFVDSLYLDELPRLRRIAPRASLRLLAHYLPSLVAGAPISEGERAALACADGSLVPSAFMARVLPLRAIVVAPAIEIDFAPRAPSRSERLRAVMVANLVEGKGVLPFIEALGDAAIELEIIGSTTHDRAYAEACRARAGAQVRFAGALPHAQTIERVRAGDVLVSASRMESFGLALAEARALGVPMVARAGGNAAAHVESHAGGALLDSDASLSRSCCGSRAIATSSSDAAARLRRRAWRGAAGRRPRASSTPRWPASRRTRSTPAWCRSLPAATARSRTRRRSTRPARRRSRARSACAALRRAEARARS